MGQHVYILADLPTNHRTYQQQLQEIQQIIAGFRLTYLTYRSNYTNDVPALIQQIIHHHPAHQAVHLVVLGSDATLQQVIQHLTHEGRIIPLTYIAIHPNVGFAKEWLREQTIRQRLEAMIYRRQPEAVPILTSYDHQLQKQRIILNHWHVGLEAEIALNFYAYLDKFPVIDRLKWHQLLYSASFLMIMKHLTSFDVELSVDGQPVEIANCQSLAVSPGLSCDGQLLDEVSNHSHSPAIALKVLHDLSVGKAAKVLRQETTNSLAKKSPHIIQQNGDVLTIHVKTPVQRQADGLDLHEHALSCTIRRSEYPLYL